MYIKTKKQIFQSGKSSAASSFSSKRFLFASFRRIAVFGRSSVISCGIWSAYGRTVTGSEFRKKKKNKSLKIDRREREYLVEKRPLRYYLNQFDCVYDHLIDDYHHFSNAILKERRFWLRNENFRSYHHVQLGRFFDLWRYFDFYLHLIYAVENIHRIIIIWK